jgi:hypothetical protein
MLVWRRAGIFPAFQRYQARHVMLKLVRRCNHEPGDRE